MARADAESSGDESWDPITQAPPGWNADTYEGEYTVKRILGHSRIKTTAENPFPFQFEIKWRGFGPMHDCPIVLGCFSEPYAKLKEYISKHQELQDCFPGYNEEDWNVDVATERLKERKRAERAERKKAQEDANAAAIAVAASQPKKKGRTSNNSLSIPPTEPPRSILDTYAGAGRKDAGRKAGKAAQGKISKTLATEDQWRKQNAQREPSEVSEAMPSDSDSAAVSPVVSKTVNDIKGKRKRGKEAASGSEDDTRPTNHGRPAPALSKENDPMQDLADDPAAVATAARLASQPSSAKKKKKTDAAPPPPDSSASEDEGPKAPPRTKKPAQKRPRTPSEEPIVEKTKKASSSQSPEKKRPRAAPKPAVKTARDSSSPSVSPQLTSPAVPKPPQTAPERRTSLPQQKVVAAKRPSISVDTQPQRRASGSGTPSEAGPSTGVPSPTVPLSAQDRWNKTSKAASDLNQLERLRNSDSWLLEHMGAIYNPAKPPASFDTEPDGRLDHIWSHFHQTTPAKPNPPCVGGLRELLEAFANDSHRTQAGDHVVPAYIYAPKAENVGTGAKGKADPLIRNDVHALSYALLAAKTSPNTATTSGILRFHQIATPPADDEDKLVVTFIHASELSRLHLARELDGLRKDGGPFIVFGPKAGTRFVFVEDAAVVVHSSVFLRHPEIFSRIGAQDQLHAWLHPGILSPTSSLGATSDLQSANRCAHFYALISLAMTLDDNPLHLIRADPDPVHTERAMIDRISCSTAFPRPGDVVEARYADCQPPLGRDPKRELNVLLEMIKVYRPRYLLIRRWLIVADDDLVVANSVGPQDDEGRKTAKLARLGAAEMAGYEDFLQVFCQN